MEMRFRNNSEQFGKLNLILLKPGVIHRQLYGADTLPSFVFLLPLILVCPIIMYPNSDNSSVLILAVRQPVIAVLIATKRSAGAFPNILSSDTMMRGEFNVSRKKGETFRALARHMDGRIEGIESEKRTSHHLHRGATDCSISCTGSTV